MKLFSLLIAFLLLLPIQAQAASPMLWGGGVESAAATCDDPGDITSSTSLLLHSNHPDGDSTVLDSGPGYHYITNSDVTHEDTFAPSIGGASSLYFDGANDNLITKQNLADFDVGTGDWTIEMIMKSSAASGNLFNIAQPSAPYSHNAFAIDFRIVSGHAYCIVDDGTTYYYAEGSVDIDDNVEHHISCLRDGNTGRIYVDGVQDTTFDVTGLDVVFDTDFAASIGSFPNLANDYAGYIAELMFTKGTALYPDGTSFDVPTEPFSSTCYPLDGFTSRLPFTTGAHAAAYDIRINITDSDFITWACGSHDNEDLEYNIAITRDDGVEKQLFEPVATDCTVSNDVDIDFTATTTDTDYYLYYGGVHKEFEWATTGLGNNDTSETYGTGETGGNPKFADMPISNGDIYDYEFTAESPWTCVDSGNSLSSQSTIDNHESLKLETSTPGTSGPSNSVSCTYNAGTFGSANPIYLTAELYSTAMGEAHGSQYVNFRMRTGSAAYNIGLSDYSGGRSAVWTGSAWDYGDRTAFVIGEDVWLTVTMIADTSAHTCDIWINGQRYHVDSDCSATGSFTNGDLEIKADGKNVAENQIYYIDRLRVGTEALGE